MKPEIRDTMSFDLRQRYRATAELIEAVRERAPLRLLDVGSREGYLGAFLPEDRVVNLDRQLFPGESFVAGDILSLPFADRTFDLVVALDVMEHIESNRRTALLEEISRVSRNYFIIGGPFHEKDVIEAEKLANSFYLRTTGRENEFLAEHRRLGLPPMEDLTDWLRRRDFRSISLPNNFLPFWLSMMAWSAYISGLPRPEKLMASTVDLYDFYLSRYDGRSPAYRQIFLVGKSGFPDEQALQEQFTAPPLTSDAEERAWRFARRVLSELDPYQARALKELQEENRRLRMEYARLEESVLPFQKLYNRIERTPFHRIYRKIRGVNARPIAGAEEHRGSQPKSTTRTLPMKTNFSNKSLPTDPEPRDRGPGENPRPGGVTVIIPNLNGREHLPRCLKSLRSTTGVDFEVMVADNGSSDGGVEWIREHHPEVRVLELGANRGFSGALMAGVRRSSRPLVCFLNNDTEVRPDWLLHLVRALKTDENIAAVSATLLYMHNPKIINFGGGEMTGPGYGYQGKLGWPTATLDDGPELEDTLFASGAAMLIDRRILLDCGGLDEKLHPIYHEDVDLGWRLWLMGYRVVISRKSLVLHHEGGDLGPRPGAEKIARLGFRHSMRCSIKNYELKRVVTALTAMAASQILLGLTSPPPPTGSDSSVPSPGRARFPDLIRRVLPAFGVIGSALTWNLSQLGDTLKQRRFVQSRRRRKDRELIRRGLIRPRPWFPFQGDYRPGVFLPFDQLFPKSELLPAADSAIGFLMEGWGPISIVGGVYYRLLNYHSRCRLRVEPGARGIIQVKAGLNKSVARGAVRVICNDQTSRWVRISGKERVKISCPARADGEGRLSIDIVADPIDYRRFRRFWWCSIQEIKFIPEAPARKREDISVIIPTHNRISCLRDCLQALAEQTVFPREVIVVDDGSTDGTPGLLETLVSLNILPFTLKTFRQDNSGPAAARNRGIERATGKVIAFLGDDMVAAPDWLEKHMAHHREQDFSCAICGFTGWDQERMPVSALLEFVNNSGHQFGFWHLQPGAETPLGAFYTSNISLPAHFLENHRFDEWFRRAAYEDTELGYRLCSRGMRIVYQPDCTVRHFHPMTAGDFCNRQRFLGGLLVRMLERRPELRPYVAIPEARSFLRSELPERVILAADRFLRAIDRRGRKLSTKVYHMWLQAHFMAGVKEAQQETESDLKQTPERIRETRKKQINIYQIYYREEQKRELDGGFSPWDNRKNLRPELAEFWVMLRAWKDRRNYFSGLTGFLSWKFYQKTGLKSEDVLTFINSHPGYDCYLFNPLTLQSALFASVWEQGEYWHPGIKDRSERLLWECGLETDLDGYVDNNAHTAYCNYFIASREFWELYFRLMKKIKEVTEKSLHRKFRLPEHTYHEGRRMEIIPFIIERCFGTLIRINPHLRVIPYRYPRDQQARRTPGFEELISRADQLKLICRDDRGCPYFGEYLKIQQSIWDRLNLSPDRDRLLIR